MNDPLKPELNCEAGWRRLARRLFWALCLTAFVAGAARAESSPFVLSPLEQASECGMNVWDASDKKIMLAHQSWENDSNRLQIDSGNGPQWLDQKKSNKIGKDLLKAGQKIRETYEGGGVSVTIKATSVWQCCGIAMKEGCECATLIGSMLVQHDKDRRNYRIEIHEGC